MMPQVQVECGDRVGHTYAPIINLRNHERAHAAYRAHVACEQTETGISIKNGTTSQKISRWSREMRGPPNGCRDHRSGLRSAVHRQRPDLYLRACDQEPEKMTQVYATVSIVFRAIRAHFHRRASPQ